MFSDVSPSVWTAMEVRAIWQQVCSALQPKLSTAVYNTWVLSNPLTGLTLDDQNQVIATITCPTAFHAANVEKNLAAMITAVLAEQLTRPVMLTFSVGNPPVFNSEPLPTGHATASPNLIASPSVSPSPTSSFSPPTTPSSPPSTPRLSPSPRVEELFSQSSLQAAMVDRTAFAARQIGLRSDYTFATFAVSTTNEMAHAAATAVSNSPGGAYNPLFLYGGVGVGKTHLMHAIGNNILKNNPDTKILYCTGEEFTNEIVSAIQTKKALKFKEKYRVAQVLLIDDVQFIAGKNAVQEEFFHTFNALTQQASQVVLTSDRPPHEIPLLEDRLRSRFEAGLMIDIQQPTFELRTAILLIKSSALNLSIPMDIAQQIAARVDSARKIEGIITSIRSAVELRHQTLSPELIEEILKGETRQARPQLKVTPIDVLRTVANHYHVKQSAIKGQRRVQALVQARHIAMYLLKEDLKMPYTEIGRWFSNRDHTSALHAVQKIDQELQRSELLQRDVSALRMSLSAISR